MPPKALPPAGEGTSKVDQGIPDGLQDEARDPERLARSRQQDPRGALHPNQNPFVTKLELVVVPVAVLA